MFKKEVKLIDSIIYDDKNPQLTGNYFGRENLVYRSLRNLFETFWIRTTPHRELYLVGGCVRDLLLGREPKDYDLCTDATPDEVKQICDALHLKYFDSGIKHGTLTIIDDFYHQQFEITTYRVDGKYSDGRHPDEVIFTPSLEEDLKRRDFTINSFAYDLLKKEVLCLDESYMNDLELGIVRTVGNADDRFNEDALRMLRAIRFSAQLGFSIAKDTFDAISKNASLLSSISKERVRDELTKIILSDNPERLDLLAITKLEEYAFTKCTPITAMLECDHQNPWHYTDVFHHTIDVIKALPKSFELRWAAFFHDIGKPACKKLKENTLDHYTYYNHPGISAEYSMVIMNELKFSNKQKELIYTFVKYHDEELVVCKESKFKKILNEIGKNNFIDFIKLRQADSNAHKLINGTKYAVDYIDKIKERYLKAINTPLTLKDLKINGSDIIADGFLHGKEIGDCLRWMLKIVLEHPEDNNREKLLEYLEMFKQMSFQSN